MNMSGVSPGCQTGKMGGNDIDNGSFDAHPLNFLHQRGNAPDMFDDVVHQDVRNNFIFKWQVSVQIGYYICGITVVAIHADVPRPHLVSTA